MDFLCNWSFASVQARCQARNTSHDGFVTAGDDDALSGSLDGVRWEEGQVFRFEWIFVGEFVVARLWFGFTSQRWIVNLKEAFVEVIRTKFWWLSKLTLKFLASITLISAGIRSPNFTSTTSPNVKSSARSVNFSPSRITVANWGTMFLNDSIIFELFDSFSSASKIRVSWEMSSGRQGMFQTHLVVWENTSNYNDSRKYNT